MEHNVPALPQQEGHNPHMAYDELAECNDNTKRVIMLHQHLVLVQEENQKEVWFYCKTLQPQDNSEILLFYCKPS